MKRLLIVLVLSMGVFFTSQQINVADAAPKVINWRFVCDYPAGDLGMEKAVPNVKCQLLCPVRVNYLGRFFPY
jgi:hypothetical protein